MRLLLAFTLALLCWSASAATEVIKTIMPGGGDYTSLAAWEAGRQTNCVTADSIEIGEIDGDWSGGADTNAVTINGWTTDATRYIEVRTTAAARHTGKWNATKYVLNTGDVDAITLVEDFVRVLGLQVLVLKTTSYRKAILEGSLSDGAIIEIGECILTIGAGSGTGSKAINTASGNVTHVIRNCVIFGTWEEGISCSSLIITLYNCTVSGPPYAYTRNSGTVTAYNCISQGSTYGFSGTIGGSNNASDIASDAPGTDPQTGTVSFVDAANGDFHLASGDTVARGNGVDLSGTFTTDLDGQTREVPWDIGADEYISSGMVPMFPGVIIMP